ncbi:MAG: hypothetical protein GKR94_17080 [Gammaproteobacteria bacterium]|nr:hypothetical protein [Gammaproteobacteria bacterium]
MGAIAGYLLYPVLLGGIIITADNQYHGKPITISMLFRGFKQQTSSLLAVGTVCLLTSLVLLGGMGLAVGGSMAFLFEATGEIPDAAMLGPLLIVSLMAALLWLPILMLLWFAPALVLLHGVPPIEAMKQSFAGCLRNFLPFFLYSLVYIPLALVALIPIGLGFFILVPVYMISLYTSYRDIYVN